MLASFATMKRVCSVLADVDVLQAMAEVGMPLLIHGEVTTAGVDIFDKEARFIEEVIKVGAHGARRHFRDRYNVNIGIVASTAVDAKFAVDPGNVDDEYGVLLLTMRHSHTPRCPPFVALRSAARAKVAGAESGDGAHNHIGGCCLRHGCPSERGSYHHTAAPALQP